MANWARLKLSVIANIYGHMPNCYGVTKKEKFEFSARFGHIRK